MNQITVFNNPEFGELRTTEINGEPWFVGKDVCQFFGDTNPNRSMGRLDECDKRTTDIMDALGRKRPTTVINESGLYALLFNMQPQKAHNGGVSDEYPTEIQERIEKLHRFKHWVTSEVLPSIRKNGGYIAGQESMSDEQLMAQALLVAQRTIEHKQRLIQEMQPKALFADAVAASKTSILVGDLAKLLRQNGYSTGQKRLFSQLREEGYLIKRKGADYNSPTQYAMELGLFEIKESSHVNSDGVTIITKTPKVTGKGQIYFINRFCGK